MLNATRDLVLPTTITGSYPRPAWFTEGLNRRPFKDALGDSVFREQYLAAVSCVLGEQVDRTVGGRSWFYYPIILSTDCGFGREGLARRIAFYKCVAITLGANLVRRELGLPQAPVPAADPRFA
jgi:methionine synthase II (cobalamin-independent)